MTSKELAEIESLARRFGWELEGMATKEATKVETAAQTNTAATGDHAEAKAELPAKSPTSETKIQPVPPAPTNPEEQPKEPVQAAGTTEIPKTPEPTPLVSVKLPIVPESAVTSPAEHPAEPLSWKCPVCDGPMVEHLARNWKNAGKKFFGCKKFRSGCRGTRDQTGKDTTRG